MPPIQEVLEMLSKIEQIHSKKNDDYASVNPFDNFQRSAMVAEWFNNRYDKVFVTLITTKLARLATLLNKGKEPNNESVDDSFLDLATYCILWSAFVKRHPEQFVLNLDRMKQVTQEAMQNSSFSGINLNLTAKRSDL